MSEIILAITKNYPWIDTLSIKPMSMASQGGFINPMVLVNVTIKSAYISVILNRNKDLHSFSTNQIQPETFLLLNNIKESAITELINDILALKYYFKETVDYRREVK